MRPPRHRPTDHTRGEGAGATSAKFAAAISNAGGLGSVGSLFRATDAVKRDIDLLPTLTKRNFAINRIPQALDADAFVTPAGAASRNLVRASCASSSAPT